MEDEEGRRWPVRVSWRVAGLGASAVVRMAGILDDLIWREKEIGWKGKR